MIDNKKKIWSLTVIIFMYNLLLIYIALKI